MKTKVKKKRKNTNPTQHDRKIVARIKKLHTVFNNTYRQTVDSAAEIGKLLLEKKNACLAKVLPAVVQVASHLITFNSPWQ